MVSVCVPKIRPFARRGGCADQVPIDSGADGTVGQLPNKLSGGSFGGSTPKPEPIAGMASVCVPKLSPAATNYGVQESGSSFTDATRKCGIAASLVFECSLIFTSGASSRSILVF